MNSKATMGIVSAVVIVASFYGGMKYDQSSNMASAAAAGMQRGAGFRGAGGGRGGMNSGFASGEVLSVDNTSITLKMKDGGSKIVILSGSTSIMKSDAGTLSDISVGKQISVMGSANSDGSVTADSIQIRPTLTNNNK